MSDPGLTPQEQQVRDLLAQARHDEPVPDDVAARLDRALTDLRDEAPAATGPVVDLAAARRRRHRVRTALVAAAAVVVVGVGVTQVDLSGLGSDSADSGSAESAADADAGGDAGEGDLESGTALAPEEAPGGGGAATLPRGVVALDSARFDTQVRRLVRDDAYQDLRSADAAARACPGPAPGPGSQIPVEYDGAPAVLVLGPAVDGVRVADLYLCGETAPTRSLRVPDA